MKYIDSDDLKENMTVHFKYECSSVVNGPYRVSTVGRGYQGAYVHLVHEITKEGLTVTLADDDDYGLPCFYVND